MTFDFIKIWTHLCTLKKKKKKKFIDFKRNFHKLVQKNVDIEESHGSRGIIK